MGAIAHKLPSRHLKKGENSCKVRSSLENEGHFVTSLRNISTHPYKSTLLGKLTHKKAPPNGITTVHYLIQSGSTIKKSWQLDGDEEEAILTNCFQKRTVQIWVTVSFLHKSYIGKVTFSCRRNNFQILTTLSNWNITYVVRWWDWDSLKGKPILKVISAAKQAYTPQWGNCGNSLTHFFDKTFAKATFLLILSKVQKS